MDACPDVLAQSPLFRHLSVAARESLASQGEHVAGGKGHRYPWRGDVLYIIITGRFRLLRHSPSDGRELALGLLGPGDAFEVIGLLDQHPYDVSAVAVEAHDLLRVRLQDVLHWTSELPAFNAALLRYLGQQLEMLADLAADLTFLETQVRLAKLLLGHVESPAGSLKMIHDLSDEVIASLVGTVRKVANRHLKALEREGILTSRRGHLRVTDLQGLKDRASGALSRIRSAY